MKNMIDSEHNPERKDEEKQATYSPQQPPEKIPGYQPSPYHKKSVFFAIILSLIIPGTGHFYLGRTYEGVLFLGIWAALAVVNLVGNAINNTFLAGVASTAQFVTGIIAAAFAYRYVQEYNYTLQLYGAPPRWAVPS
ncbi:MAG: DUF6677 family protein [Thermoplasmata archaeon]